MVFSTNQIPVSEECILKQEDVARWPYLKDVRLPKDTDEQKLNLFIGLDVTARRTVCCENQIWLDIEWTITKK